MALERAQEIGYDPGHMNANDTKPSLNFIQEIVAQDRKTNKWEGRVHTRFPPEPNGYLHIGHAKSICLNFGLAAENEGGLCNLRFDDTNPIKEEAEYVESIMQDVRWLGFDLEGRVLYASDYFEQMYDYAVKLVRAGKAYVCDLSPQETRDYRGTLTSPGKDSPFRNRTVEENLDLLGRMRAGEFADGSRTLRAKIDMASPNLNMRDPVIYRILRATHHRTGQRITAPVTIGAFIPCTTGPTAWKIPSNESPIPSVPSSLKTTARCTIGFWISWTSTIHSRSSSPDSISPIR